jgi:voltage-gated potassium channel
MAHALLRPAVLDVIDLATHYSSLELQIEEVTVAGGELAAGETLATSRIREEMGIIVIAIKRADGEMLFNPPADARIEVGDRLVLMGQQASLRVLERRLQAA